MKRWNLLKGGVHYLIILTYFTSCYTQYTNITRNETEDLFEFATGIPKQAEYGNETNKTTKWTFKDYMDKYKLHKVWQRIDKTKYLNLKEDSHDKDLFETITSAIDETDDLLKLKVPKGNPKINFYKNRRSFVNYNFNALDPLNVNVRVSELMKQSIYQARESMVEMQQLREENKNTSLYKMGFLMSKMDNTVKLFSKISRSAFKMCYIFTVRSDRTRLDLTNIVESLEKMLDFWFESDLFLDIIELNDKYCKQMMAQIAKKRPEVWKFVDDKKVEWRN